VIKIRDLHKKFGKQQVLNGVTLDIRDGENLCIVGGSGSGKSVLIKLVLGLLEPDDGDIWIEGRNTRDFREEDWNRQFEDIGMVFQGAALFDSLPVWENVGLRLVEKHEYSEGEIRTSVLQAISRVGLEESVLDKYPAELSGGMKKRVGIARAIIHHPRYLFYDEPTTGLDPVNSEIIDSLIVELAEADQTSIIITHDMKTVKKVATSVAMIQGGKILFYGNTKDFFDADDPDIQAFLARER